MKANNSFLLFISFCFLKTTLLATPVFLPKYIKKEPVVGIKTIVLDAGHGGKDPGCFGHPLVEGKLNLAIAFKLGAFIEKNLPDIKVIYTRKTDKFLDIYQRAAIATRVKADLFISIHCNTMLAGARKDVQGTEVYVFGTYKTDENEEIAQRFIARENNSILLENDYPKYYGGFDPAVASTQAILTVKQSIFKEQSLKLANGIINESKKLLRITRGVYEGSFALLSLTTMPSVLVQTGYLSNPEENNELETERGQSRIAKSIFRAIKAYKKSVEPAAESSALEIDPEQDPLDNAIDSTQFLPSSLDGNDLLLAAKQVKKTKTKGKKSRKKETDILPKASETLSEASETLSEAAKNVDKIDEIALKRSETAPKVNRKAAYRAKVAAVVLLKGSIKKDSIKTTESITENGLRFSIQIASNNAPLPPQSPVKRVGSAVREEFIEERYRYLVGNFKTQEEALATQKIYRKKGFKGAFILRFQDGVKQ